jgi:membrane protein
VVGRVGRGVGRDHLSIIAAGVAFFATLAIFPAIAALIALYGLVADPAQVAQSLEAAKPVLPPDVFAMIEDQVDALIAARPAGLGLASVVSLALTLWSARAGVTALMEGLNVVYRETDTRSFLVQYLVSLVLTLMVIAVAIVALLAVVAVPAALHFSDIGAVGALLAQVTPLLILGVAVVFAIGVLYRYGPHRARARRRWVTVGAVLATFGWLVASLALSVYVSRFANFNQTYGSLGAIVGLLFWLYASAFVVLLGAEINAELELETAHDTTTGPPKPMGERGAYVADHVA